MMNSSFCFKQSRLFESFGSFITATMFMNYAFQREPNLIRKRKYLKEYYELKDRHNHYKQTRFNTGV